MLQRGKHLKKPITDIDEIVTLGLEHFRNYLDFVQYTASTGLACFLALLSWCKMGWITSKLPNVEIEAVNNNPNFNTTSKNRSLTTFSQYLTVFATLGLSFGPRSFMNYLRPEPTTLLLCLHDFPFQMTCGFTVPFVLYYFNNEARRYINRMIEEVWLTCLETCTFNQVYPVNQ